MPPVNKRKRRPHIKLTNYVSVDDLRPAVQKTNVATNNEIQRVLRKAGKIGEGVTYYNFTYNREYIVHLGFDSIDVSLDRCSNNGKKRTTKDKI
jgi:hypothetical protein